MYIFFKLMYFSISLKRAVTHVQCLFVPLPIRRCERLCYNIMLLYFVVTVRPVDIEVIANKDRRPEPKCDFSRKCEERKDNKDIYLSMVE